MFAQLTNRTHSHAGGIENIVIIRHFFDLSVRKISQDLFFQKITFGNRHGHVKNHFVAGVRKRDFHGVIILHKIFASIGHRLHTGVKLFHGRNHFFKTFFFAFFGGGARQSNFKKAHFYGLGQITAFFKSGNFPNRNYILH